jgi:phosphoribosylformylglycinamidine synthase
VDSSSPCVFTEGVEYLYLPIRHGEGKLVGEDPALSTRLVGAHQATVRYAVPGVLRPTMEYPYNPNGSESGIAGLCDPTGRVFGLMPHPEAYLHRTNHPRWTREDLPEEGSGLTIFRNAARCLAA